MDDPVVTCDICLRPCNSRLPFNCTGCARNALYEPRIRLAETLLENEAAGQEIERSIGAMKIVDGKDFSTSRTQSQDISPVWALEQIHAEEAASKERTQQAVDHAEVLRQENDKKIAEIAERKSKLLRRRAELKSATDELSQRKAATLEPMEKTIKHLEHRWDAMHTKTMEARVFLCREAAQLYGLQQRKRKGDRPGRDIYVIGGVPIADLRDLNNASPVHVTTSATNLANLVHLVSHYLSLRLPAEITLAHRDYPLPTIFSPGSSYLSRDVPYPGSTPLHSSNNSPSESRIADQRSSPRPRPLHLDRKLSALAKEDPIAYALFVEGITLLAWDVAWVCKTQGMDVGGFSWEEVCAMGKNLWQLLIAPSSGSKLPHALPGPRMPPISESPSKPTQSRTPGGVSETPTEEPKASAAALGHFSHGTAHSFLGAAVGTEHMRGWRLQSPIKVIEKVKAMLLSERTGAEWEILEENEWEEEPSTGNGDGKEEEAPVGGTGDEEAKGKGTSGWMKVKSRGGT